MTTRKSLPYDVARCHGTYEPLCDRCARLVFSGPRDCHEYLQPWIDQQIQDGQCPQFIDMEMSDD